MVNHNAHLVDESQFSACMIRISTCSGMRCGYPNRNMDRPDRLRHVLSNIFFSAIVTITDKTVLTNAEK